MSLHLAHEHASSIVTGQSINKTSTVNSFLRNASWDLLSFLILDALVENCAHVLQQAFTHASTDKSECLHMFC